MFATFRFQGSYRDLKKHHGLNELVETIISFQVTLLKLKSTSRNYKHSKALHSIRGIAGNISLDLRLRVWEDSIRLEDTEGYYVGIIMWTVYVVLFCLCNVAVNFVFQLIFVVSLFQIH